VKCRRITCNSAQMKVRVCREDFMCDMLSVLFSETVIVTLLKFVAWKRLMEIVID
jgi:hypothetical protein